MARIIAFGKELPLPLHLWHNKLEFTKSDQSSEISVILPFLEFTKSDQSSEIS